MASALAKPPGRQQKPRPISTASPSVVTVHQANATHLLNGGGQRHPITGLRAKSPFDNTPTTSPYSNTRTFQTDLEKRSSPETSRRSSAFYNQPDSKNGFTDNSASLNRWSQSTGSSKRTSAQYHRKSSFSKRLSGSLGSLGTYNDAQTQIVASNPNKRPRSPLAIPATAMRASPTSEVPPPILPPIATLSSLSHAVDAADSPSSFSAHTPATADLLSPAAYRSDQDYFGGQWDLSPAKNTIAGKTRSRRVSARASPAAPQSPNLSNTKIPESVYSPRAAAFSKQELRRHSGNRRHRTSSVKSNGTTEGESSASDHREIARKQRKRRAPSQKALLSKALAKANHAVVLDGKQNVEGAILAYGDACNLLRQVMVRSSGEDDRRKLEAVRNTYKNRIVELRTNDPAFSIVDNKALPARPLERDSAQTELTIVTDDDESVGEARHSIPVGHDSGYGSGRYKHYQTAGSSSFIPPRRQSLHTSSRRPENQGMNAEYGQFTDPYHSHAFGYNDDLPPPLSPRRALSPDHAVNELLDDHEDESGPEKSVDEQHTSWLNTINESDGSDVSSVHSRRSSVGLRRRQIRGASGDTEAEFDAALDAAIETAYDDGFEPDDEAEDDTEQPNGLQYRKAPPRRFSAIKRNIEQAKQNVRDIEREAVVSAARKTERDRQHTGPEPLDSLDEEVNNESEEEEKLLEEMTRDFVFGDAEYDVQTKSALPRQSDGGGFPGKPWASGVGSHPTPPGAPLSRVAEGKTLSSLIPQIQQERVPPLMHPPPSGALPQPPASFGFEGTQSENVSQRDSHKHSNFARRTSSPSVRERRLSGMNAKELKIETNAKAFSVEAPKTQPPPIPAPMVPPQMIPEAPQSALGTEESFRLTPSPLIKENTPSSAIPIPTRKASFPLTSSDIGEPVSSTASALTKVTSADSDTLATSMPNSPARFASKPATGLRKNFSSSSLRSKAVSANGDHDTSPNTSVSSISSAPKARGAPSPAVPVLPTPIETSFLPKGQQIGGAYLFECDIHSPLSPGSPNPLANNAPLPLEPCPESSLLRPFWFLRSIYQTIAHPRGGYITTRLFIPRDIWRVKNIKLKNVEEKVSTCDLLTAALLKLGKVDTFNADAVLEEMQFLENVMERAQSNLAKKLGSEVGVQGALASFKGVNLADESASNSETINQGSVNANKSYLKGWRRLRSKNSLGPSMAPSSATGTSKHDLRDAPSMSSLPMNNASGTKFPKRDVSQVQCVGPNPSYMGALARLCDAAQILDQIARQVEDPGLKHSSPTQIGLELCTRHASEFFGFYICRFVLADIGLMLDKFVKRSSEWVLA